jgi:hypothetical protein
VTFSTHPRIVGGRGQFGVAQFGGQERGKPVEVQAEVASLKAHQKRVHCQFGKHPTMHDLGDRIASLNPTGEDFGQPKVNVDWTIDGNVGMKAHDEPCRPVAGSERKLGERTDRQDQKHWEIVMVDQDDILFDIKSSEEKQDPIRSRVLSSQCSHLREQKVTFLSLIRNTKRKMNGRAKWELVLGL